VYEFGETAIFIPQDVQGPGFGLPRRAAFGPVFTVSSGSGGIPRSHPFLPLFTPQELTPKHHCYRL